MSVPTFRPWRERELPEAQLTCEDELSVLFRKTASAALPAVAVEKTARPFAIGLLRGLRFSIWSLLNRGLLALAAVGSAGLIYLALREHWTGPVPPIPTTTILPSSPFTPSPAIIPTVSRSTNEPVRRHPTRHPTALPLPAVVPVVPPAPNVTSPVPHQDQELTWLSQAMRQLHRENDPEGAIATLVAYRNRFPRGELWGEAVATELDADLALGRRQEALDLLQGLENNVQKLPRANEWQLVQAELLTGKGEWPDAQARFTRLLGRSLPNWMAERALYGRATCSVHLGDPESGRRDLEDYLRRFPRGRFAAAAQRSLAHER